MGTITEKYTPNGYDSKLSKTVIYLCVNDKILNNIEHIISQYRAIYIMYIKLLWNTVKFDSMGRLMMPINFLKSCLRRKKKFTHRYDKVTRVMVDRVLYYVYKAFNMHYQDIWGKSMKWNSFEENENEIISYINTLIRRMDVDIPAFSLLDDYLIINKKDINIEMMKSGFMNIPKYGKLLINMGSMNNIPKHAYIQGILVLNSKYKINRDKLMYLPCIVYYNAPIHNVKLSKHLQYYNTLNLIRDISFREENGIYCAFIRYYKTLSDKKYNIDTICAIHDIIKYPNEEDLKIIRKYADMHFRYKNDYQYDIIIMKDGTVSAKYNII